MGITLARNLLFCPCFLAVCLGSGLWHCFCYAGAVRFCFYSSHISIVFVGFDQMFFQKFSTTSMSGELSIVFSVFSSIWQNIFWLVLKMWFCFRLFSHFLQRFNLFASPCSFCIFASSWSVASCFVLYPFFSGSYVVNYLGGIV